MCICSGLVLCKEGCVIVCGLGAQTCTDCLLDATLARVQDQETTSTAIAHMPEPFCTNPCPAIAHSSLPRPYFRVGGPPGVSPHRPQVWGRFLVSPCKHKYPPQPPCQSSPAASCPPQKNSATCKSKNGTMSYLYLAMVCSCPSSAYPTNLTSSSPPAPCSCISPHGTGTRVKSHSPPDASLAPPHTTGPA